MTVQINQIDLSTIWTQLAMLKCIIISKPLGAWKHVFIILCDFMDEKSYLVWTISFYIFQDDGIKDNDKVQVNNLFIEQS